LKRRDLKGTKTDNIFRLRILSLSVLNSAQTVICLFNEGKAIRVQDWTGPEVSMTLMFPDFKTVDT